MYIKCENLTLGYENQIITKDLNFEINKGDYLCIVGENGAGKSTLMKTLLGLIKPINGSIIRSNELNKYDIGYLPQQTVVQKDFPASVKEIVLSGTLTNGKKMFYTKEDKQKAKENMQKMNVYNLRNKCYRNLSGGQQQRVLLARALCSTNKILLLDEPVTGLDPKVTNDMYELIKELNKEGITIIMISHDINAAIKYSTHILQVGKEQLFFGETKKYIKTTNYEKLGGTITC